MTTKDDCRLRNDLGRCLVELKDVPVQERMNHQESTRLVFLVRMIVAKKYYWLPNLIDDIIAVASRKIFNELDYYWGRKNSPAQLVYYAIRSVAYRLRKEESKHTDSRDSYDGLTNELSAPDNSRSLNVYEFLEFLRSEKYDPQVVHFVEAAFTAENLETALRESRISKTSYHRDFKFKVRKALEDFDDSLVPIR